MLLQAQGAFGLRRAVNERILSHSWDPFLVVVGTAAASTVAFALWSALRGSVQTWRLPIRKRFRNAFFRLVWRLMPANSPISRLRDREVAAAKAAYSKTFAPVAGETFSATIPPKSSSPKQVTDRLQALSSLLAPAHSWEEGHVSGAVYHGGPELSDVVVGAMRQFLWTNPLHPQLFPAVRKMDAEVVQWTAALFSRPSPVALPGVCGVCTSGGTESIMMAVRAYREYGRNVRGIHRPELVVATSAHPAFDKAADYLGVKVVHVPVVPATGAADVPRMAAAITRNTVALVASAPSFPVGAVDDVAALAAVARRAGVGLHVDACLGGFVLGFLAGTQGVPHIGFSVPGVTTMSADTHKYGFGPKGNSVVLYATPELRSSTFFIQPDWPGGIYGTATIAGSRPGAITAGTWAAMVHMGLEGYTAAAQRIVATTRTICSAAAQTPGVIAIGATPGTTVATGPTVVVALRSTEFDIYVLGDRMRARGWELAALMFPAGLHFGVTHVHTREGVAEAFISDLRAVAAELMAMPVEMRREAAKASPAARLYGSSQAVPDRNLVAKIAGGFFEAYYDSARGPSQ